MNAIINKEYLKNNIINNGYATIENFLNIDEINKIENSLVSMLQYINKSDENGLTKKYYEIKNYNKILLSHFYDLLGYNIDMLQLLYRKEIVDFVKEFFDTDVLYGTRPAIHIHDDENKRILYPHQETNQVSADLILLWLPLYNTNKKNGTLSIYKDSHIKRYVPHYLNRPDLEYEGSISSLDYSTHVKKEISDMYERKELEIKAGTALLIDSALIHCGYPTHKKNSVRFIISERYCPLKKLPYLKSEDVEMKIPYENVDLNMIEE